MLQTITTLFHCSTADVLPMLAEQAEVEKKMQSMQVTAAPEEPAVSGPETVTAENVPKVCPLGRVMTMYLSAMLF